MEKVGGLGILGGRIPLALVMAAWTSIAAASIFLERSNWRFIVVLPWVLVEFMVRKPSIEENCFSRGVATLDAMVSGSAPGNEADTDIVGKST